MLVFALALLASELGLDLLLGGFAAGLITRQMLKTRELPAFDSKLTAVAFGVFVPFFFVVERHEPERRRAVRQRRPALLKMVAVLRPVPRRARHARAAALPRRARRARARRARADVSSTQLPLVLAITTLATRTGHMRTSTAAALVGAAVLSTLVYPMLGLRVRGDTLAGLTADPDTMATET